MIKLYFCRGSAIYHIYTYMVYMNYRFKFGFNLLEFKHHATSTTSPQDVLMRDLRDLTSWPLGQGSIRWVTWAGRRGLIEPGGRGSRPHYHLATYKYQTISSSFFSLLAALLESVVVFWFRVKNTLCVLKFHFWPQSRNHIACALHLY